MKSEYLYLWMNINAAAIHGFIIPYISGLGVILLKFIYIIALFMPVRSWFLAIREKRALISAFKPAFCVFILKLNTNA